MFYEKPSKEQILVNKGRPCLDRLPARFKLCVWNLHKCKDRGWAETFEKLCAGTDLFMAQEAIFLPEAEPSFLAAGMHWTAAVSFLSPRKRAPVGVATGCRAPALQAAYRAHVSEPFLNTPKMTLATVYATRKGPLLAINLHAINFKGLNAFKLNLQKAEELLDGFPGAVVAAGDFNAWSQNRLLAMRQAAARLKLDEAAFEPDLRATFFGKRVDFLFTRGVKVHRAYAVRTRASDHNPLMAELELTSKYAKI